MKTKAVKSIISLLSLSVSISAVAQNNSLVTNYGNTTGSNTQRYSEQSRVKLNSASGTASRPAAAEDVKSSKKLDPQFEQKLQKLLQGGVNGGGGDEVGLEVQQAILRALDNMRSNPELQAVSAKYNLRNHMNQVRIVTLDETLRVELGELVQNSAAVNVPELQLILVNRARWKSLRSAAIKEGIGLHELLSLLKIEATGIYTYSGRYVASSGENSQQLKNELSVNRFQQISFQYSAKKPIEVLYEFFEEARQPIDIRDLESEREILKKLKNETYDVECASVQVGDNEIKEGFQNVDPKLHQHDWLATTDPSLVSGGPLFSGNPIYNTRIVDIDYRRWYDNSRGFFEKGLFNESKLQISPTELTQTYIRAYGPHINQLEHIKGEIKIRKNNDLIVFRDRKAYLKSNKGGWTIWGYCYPKNSK